MKKRDFDTMYQESERPLCVGIIGAMEEEVEFLRAQIENAEHFQRAGYDFYSGKLAGEQVVLLKSGIGKVNAAIGTAILLEHFSPHCVINTGSAGGFDKTLEIGDVVISSEVRHHDFDLTCFGYEHGQVAGMPPAFIPDARLVAIAEQSIRTVDGVKVVKGLVATGDYFMSEPSKVAETRARYPNLMAVEMEAAAIAQTCFRFDVPFMVFRALSDIAGKESPVSFQQFLTTAGVNSAQMVIEMVRELGERIKGFSLSH